MNQFVRAKKHLGQHFLNDESIAQDIVNALCFQSKYKQVLEIGPGMGVLTKYLSNQYPDLLSLVELDRESIAYLKKNFPQLENKIIEDDFLQLQLENYFSEPFAVIGNFPYNISTQILFKVLDYKDQIPEVVGMFQKEVAERIASGPGNKHYGIISVLLQAYYNIEYLFTVQEHVFIPPPKVKSGVIRLHRNDVRQLPCNERLFINVVKTAFNQRRKTLRNALSKFTAITELKNHIYLSKRAEQLSVKDFVELTNLLDK